MVDIRSLQQTPMFGVPTSQPQSQPNSLSSLLQGGVGGDSGVRPEPEQKKHGTVDNILGFLGDFLTSRLRMGTPYRDARQNEKLNAAMQGVEQDPQAAFARVRGLDFNAGNKLAESYIDNQRIATSQESLAEARTARIEQQKEVERTSTLDRVARYMNGIANLPPEKRAAAYADALKLQTHSQSIRSDPILQQRLAEYYPEEYNENAITSSIAQSVPVAQQWRIQNQDEQFDERNATTQRGQDINSSDRAASRGVSERGQDIASEDRKRGQDINSADRKAGQQETKRANKAREEKFKPDPNKVYIQGGKRYKYTNGKYVPIK